MVQQSVYSPLHISVYYTRAALSSKLLPSAQPSLTLSPGRPRIPKILDAAISRAVSLGAGIKDSQRITGLLVAVCGPAALGDDVSKAVGAIEPSRRDQVGGIEMHEEYVFHSLHASYVLIMNQGIRMVAGLSFCFFAAPVLDTGCYVYYI